MWFFMWIQLFSAKPLEPNSFVRPAVQSEAVLCPILYDVIFI